MLESIIVGVLSLTGTVIGSFSGMRLMSYRIEQLEKKVDKHNNFAERIPLVEQRMKVCEHRIDDLEETEKENRRLEHEN